MWGLPLFDIKDLAAVLFEVNMCKRAKPNYYVKCCAFDNSRGVESCVMSFMLKDLLTSQASRLFVKRLVVVQWFTLLSVTLQLLSLKVSVTNKTKFY